MPQTLPERTSQLQQRLQQLDPGDAEYASRFVGHLLEAARAVRASDVHLQPTSAGLEIRWRLDGVLQSLGTYSPGEAADVVSRLKVLAELLTYRTDVPQEGRLSGEPGVAEIRVSTFPTLYGERAVLRLFDVERLLLLLEDLRLPGDVARQLTSMISETGGVLIFCGPAGSGKTTSAYACVREIIRRSGEGKSVMTLEDPIEVAVKGASQSQLDQLAGFALASALQSLLRQDPEVILVGEIRDPVTAEQVFQASLTGHLVLTTFHAGSAAEAIGRLAEMEIEPYQLRSGLLGIVSQRLVRCLCRCARTIEQEHEKLGMKVEQARAAVGCEACLQTGYAGRTVLAEVLATSPSEIGQAILSCEATARLQKLAVENGMVPLWQRAEAAVEHGMTSPAEIRRVFGFRQMG